MSGGRMSAGIFSSPSQRAKRIASWMPTWGSLAFWSRESTSANRRAASPIVVVVSTTNSILYATLRSVNNGGPFTLITCARVTNNDFAAAARALGLDLTDAQLSTFVAYRDLIAEATQRFSLTAVRDPDVIERRHLLEGLAFGRR